MQSRSQVGLVILFAVILASCDTAPGPPAPPSPAPQVSDFSYSPAFVDLSKILPIDTLISIQVDASVRLSDADDNVSSVEMLLRSPLDGEPVVATATLQNTGGNQYSVSTNVEFSIGAQGLYTLLVYAIDEAGNLSNQARGLINFGSSVPFGTPPVVEMIEALPNPAVPGQTLKMIASVSDREGLSNILNVVIGLTNPPPEPTVPPQDSFFMFDDGASSNDDVAGDGRFTASFFIDAGQPPDTTTFYVQAFDRNGFSSEVDSLEVRVQ